MVKLKHLLFVLLTLTALVHAQDQSGFISIDCGLPENSSYADGTTGIYYVSDADYTDAGVSKTISPRYKTNDLKQQFLNVRSFPQGIKNCYTLIPPQLKNRTRYFIRARFMYGNYDNKNQVPKFDLYLGVNFWVTVEFSDASSPFTMEILHVPPSNYTYVCLVNTGNGTPFISALELRLVDDGIYETESESLELFNRYDLRSIDNKEIIRYKDDIFDRIWRPSFFQNETVSELSTPLTIGADYQNIYKLPSVVMTTAITPRNASNPLEFYWVPPDPTIGYYIYMHFADFQSNQSREFKITLNEIPWISRLKPNYLYTTTAYSTKPETPAARVNFSLVKTENSTLPPIFNALEIYTLKQFSDLQTDQEDVNAIKEIKAAYGVKKNWQGDPCTPKAYTWEGLDCFNDSFIDPPRIISLNLSFSGLTGNISPSIFNLKMLQYLDLSYNSLTWDVPDFLTQMEKLTVLKLSGNNFTGTLPAKLLERSKSGSLSLSVEGNPNLCKSEPCEDNVIKPKEGDNVIKPKEEEKKKNNMIIIIIASIAAVCILLIAIAILWMLMFRIKKRKSPQQQVASVTTEVVVESSIRETPFQSRQPHYTYSEVMRITGNFQRVLGKGAFGEVYHGNLGDTQVAVKMLSPSSTQGYREFKAEAELLMRVHHRNLTALVGYCYEGDKLGLIYEYMANGDLHKHLSGRNFKFLNWETRLEIAIDAAQGLEYLHTGCTPPIIHRDVKSTNILLTEGYHAKLADFGLSKDFPVAGKTHVSTIFAGTPGYLDPEYKLNEKSDVFSFGVVLLEIITSKPVVSRMREKNHISEWVDHMLKTKANVRDVVDPRLGNDFDLNSVWKAVDLAMECVAAASSARPPMNHVVIELKQCLRMEKARMNRSESNYESSEMSSLNIDTTGMNPRAR